MVENKVKVYKRVGKTSESKTKAGKRISASDVCFFILSYLLSRAMLFNLFCPFGVALVAASYKRKNALFCSLSAVLGVLTSGIGIRSVQYVLVLCIVNLYKLILDKRDNGTKMQLALISGVANFLGCIIASFFAEFTLRMLFLNILESAILYFSILLFSEIDAVSQQNVKYMGMLYPDAFFGLSALFGLAIYGVGNLLNFGPLNLCEILWSIMVLCFANLGGVYGGLSAGIVTGLVAAMSATDILNVIGLYGICGFACGYAKRGGKLLISAAYILSAVGFGLATTIFMFGQLKLINFMISAVLFLCIPNRFFDKLFICTDGGYSYSLDNVYGSRFNEIISEKFDAISNAFETMSETVERLSIVKADKHKVKYSKIVDDTVNKVCSGCGMCVYCWDKESDKTGKCFERIIERLTHKGYVDVMDFEREFRKRCPKVDEHVQSVNNLYAIERLNAVWDGQLNESRTLLSGQYKDFSVIMHEMSQDIQEYLTGETVLKNRILSEMERYFQNVTKVEMYHGTDKIYDVELYLKELDETFNVELAEKCLTKCIGRPMRVSVIDETCCCVRFVPIYNYKLLSSVASLKKDGEHVNGDNYAVSNLNGCRCVLMLSDGMGSGEFAACESHCVIQLMQKLLDIGFGIDTAIRLVNSALVLKSGSESFATLDIAVVDLISGIAEFYKVGGAPGFIKRHKSIELVSGNSLPMGILSTVDAHNTQIRLNNEDYLILLSDGISNMNLFGESLGTFIGKLPANDPENVAKAILNYAIENSKNEIEDDITVMVAKIVVN